MRNPIEKVTTCRLVIVLWLSLLSLAAFAQSEQERKVRSKVEPSYPALARQTNVRGTVRLLVMISPSGNVKDSKVLGGNPLLVAAAVDAVKQWKFEPGIQESSQTVEFRFEPPH